MILVFISVMVRAFEVKRAVEKVAWPATWDVARGLSPRVLVVGARASGLIILGPEKGTDLFACK
ncbi:hypothetical protein D3C80_2076140 [compost metagenome]